MKTKSTIYIFLLSLGLCLHAENTTAFSKFQALLSEKTFETKDAGNLVSERITVEKNNGKILFNQTISSSGRQGSVEVRMTWPLDIPLFLSAKIEKHEFYDKTVKISFVSESGAEIFPYNGTTTFRTTDGRTASENQSGKAERFGISFNNQKEVEEFLALYNDLIRDLKTKS